MGRGPFYGGARKMRGFPLNMSPGSLDDQQPGFPYFAGSAEVKFEFGYGPGSFHPDFFGHHGGPHPGAGPGGPFGHPGKRLRHFTILKYTEKLVFNYYNIYSLFVNEIL